MPGVSVIIPCYHDEMRLTYLLKQLHQLPHRPAEIIVVDGADSRKCREICKHYQVFWLASESCRGRPLLAGSALPYDLASLYHSKVFQELPKRTCNFNHKEYHARNSTKILW